MRTVTRWLLWGTWGICLLFVVWAGWSFVRTMVYTASGDDPPGTVTKAGCAEAMDFSGTTLPEDTRDEDCTSYTWGGQAYDGSFRMPRSAVGGWLAESFPDAADFPCDGDDDRCVHVIRETQAHPHTHTPGAYDVTVSVHYEHGDEDGDESEGGSAGDTALVSFDASSY
ncbi:hypothetical protein [Streptomyces sp. MBT62]|uniref:hypothetical protein n=1 Tax=Streptomyces sp. MBT62 TaxID=2800410 RepID=UPI0019094D99|nr:hypothetical protein [Streptomyces sp. MBT62]MBK3565305.1 hypothetical protein [Streptomyces sp. MBT62]